MEIAIFGAGQKGIQALLQIGKDKVCCFIENNKQGHVLGVPLIPLSRFSEQYSSDTLIVIPSEKYKEEMIELLREHHLENYLYFTPDEIQSDHSQRLTAEEWGAIYGSSILPDLLRRVSDRCYSVQTIEMLRLTKPGDRVLEIGCGSGETSLVLALEGRKVSVLDYSEEVIALVTEASRRLGVDLDARRHDATLPLPYAEREFDYIFQARLLEHFSKEDRIKMLGNWRAACKTMVSMIPNAHSVAYRLGKHMMEQNHTWKYGLEMSQASLYDDFAQSGYSNIIEYTVGAEHSLEFLPKDHYFRAAMEKILREYPTLNDLGQGYLLTTVGNN